MGQLSIYDKQRHHSEKDFTCSIGKKNKIYITFRHDTWKRFTTSEKITVTVNQTSTALKFGDPQNKGIGLVYKLKTPNKGDAHTVEHTRYLAIDGNAYPAVLEVVRNVVGSYDLPKDEEKAERVEQLKKSLESAPAKVEAITESKTLREHFMEDARELLKDAKTDEERVAIYNALGAVYGFPKGVVRYEVPKQEVPADKWSIGG